MLYVFDANAMLALLYDEAGADKVENLLNESGSTCCAHAVNLCEVFYGVMKPESEAKAQQAIADLLAAGIQCRADMDNAFWLAAGKLKGSHKMSIADAFALALTDRIGGQLITSDHHELDPLAAAGFPITFFR